MHPSAKVWVMSCGACKMEYGCNSSVAFIRRCPYCDPKIAPGEPI